ncbi:succinylglutamate desuccinylase/aspartoacylase family protein [Humibacter ginsengiterrae]
MTTSTWTRSRIGDERPGIGVTLYRLSAAVPGPRLVVLAGVHGNEIGGILAAGRLTRTPLPLAAGMLDVVPVTHEAANEAFLRESPADGGNLARLFPGDPQGPPTARLAALVAERVIDGADAMIDLHTSSPDADLPLFAGSLHDGSAAGDAGVRMAVAFGTGTLWTHPELGPGRTLTVAAERGIPAIYVESPHGGVLSEAMLAVYSDGVLRVCASLGMVPDAQASPAPPLTRWLHGNGDTDTFNLCRCDGYFVSDVELLQSVEAGQIVGRVLDERGRELARVDAAADGVVTYLRRQARVRPDDALAQVTAQRSIGLLDAEVPQPPSAAVAGRHNEKEPER